MKSSVKYNEVAIIIPAYNEGKSIKEVIDGIPHKYQNIVVVDDGSADDTSAQVEKTRAKLVTHTLNLGQGASLQTGIEYALFNEKIKYFVTYDADGQHQIQDVDALLEHLVEYDVDIVMGSRFMGIADNITLMKKIVLRAAVKFSNISTGLKLTDTHNGLRVFNRKVAQGMQLTMADFAHASEILERISERGYKYAELPVRIIYTDYSRGKGQSMINAVNIAFDLMLKKVLSK